MSLRDPPAASRPPGTPSVWRDTADQSGKKLTIEEVAKLGSEFKKTSRAIYSFLDKQAGRSDEPKVVAEYRKRFDAKVLNLCLDLVSAGLATTEHLKNAMKPPASVDDIQWIARVLAISGEGYSAERLAEKLREVEEEGGA